MKTTKKLTLAQRFARVHALFTAVSNAISAEGFQHPGADSWLNRQFRAQGDDHFNPEVWMSMGLDNEPRVQVNWPSIGAQSAASAIVAAEALARAARTACRIQLAIDRAHLAPEDFNAYSVTMEGVWSAMVLARAPEEVFWEAIKEVLADAERDASR